MSSRERPSRRSYPLAALFLLVAVCAVLSAMAAPASKGLAERYAEGIFVLLASSLAGSFVIGALGSLVGLFHHRRLMGMLLGGATGAAIGLLAGPIVMVQVEEIGAVVLASLFGSLVLVLMAGMTRIGR